MKNLIKYVLRKHLLKDLVNIILEYYTIPDICWILYTRLNAGTNLDIIPKLPIIRINIYKKCVNMLNFIKNKGNVNNVYITEKHVYSKIAPRFMTSYIECPRFGHFRYKKNGKKSNIHDKYIYKNGKWSPTYYRHESEYVK
jgi:hypothetical protein